MQFAGGKAEFPARLKSKAAHRTIPLPPNLAAALEYEKKQSNSFFVIHTSDGQHIFRKISADREILPMTEIELIEYLRAMHRAEITDRRIQNNSDISLWFQIDSDMGQ